MYGFAGISRFGTQLRKRHWIPLLHHWLHFISEGIRGGCLTFDSRSHIKVGLVLVSPGSFFPIVISSLSRNLSLPGWAILRDGQAMLGEKLLEARGRGVVEVF
jgi:hypothetical protein